MDNKIKNLIALRNNYFTSLYLVTGGTVGLSLTEPASFLAYTYLIIGYFLMFIFFFSIRRVSKEIGELTKGEQ